MNFVYFNTIIADLTIFYKNKNSQQLCKLFLEEKYYELKNDTESVNNTKIRTAEFFIFLFYPHFYNIFNLILTFASLKILINCNNLFLIVRATSLAYSVRNH